MYMPIRFIAAVVICTAAPLPAASDSGSAGGALTIKLPPESVQFKSGPGTEIANNNCQICHSADYVSTQPVSTSREKWAEIVAKMQSTYGAPIQNDQIDPLVDYLVKHYGDEQTE